jgi:hypothetical protein
MHSIVLSEDAHDSICARAVGAHRSDSAVKEQPTAAIQIATGAYPGDLHETGRDDSPGLSELARIAAGRRWRRAQSSELSDSE